jgi:DNA primase
VSDEHPFDRFVGGLRDRGFLTGPSCKVGPNTARGRCPAHADYRASLSVTRKDDRVLVRCFANCRIGDVVSSLGMRMAELFSHGRGLAVPPAIIAAYDYVDRHGVLDAQKLRYSNKTFRWRRPGRLVGSWINNLHGATPGLYRLPELAECYQVFLNEGEKATDLVWRLGLPATCPPCGSSSWLPSWSRDLWDAGCRELIILADNDLPGDRHAERVAALTSGIGGDEPLGVKVLRLPGLEKGADAFDWLDGGSTPLDLLNLAAEAAWWSPYAKEQERLDRRRARGRERQQRFRHRRRLEPVSDAVNVPERVA